MKKLLFVCGKNRLRSPTAEAIFSEYEGLEVESAGVDREAEVPLSNESIQWADIIFVMEPSHRSKLTNKFQPLLKNKRVICLDIPDHYGYMEPVLVELLKQKVLPLLGTF
ncbi:low molecular weight protein tyrosine phosphatase family protein (plasmid) [Kovacikia minuta CCNUW1]|uniref:low molecular weight protein tyrosine phosphatase family protein n=1 Tax=Kovacikia minuta TaxID=2931930 RepID=UPI001CCC66F6|nr:low molecular weight protein tyrosine phosphatase family protein [Kovacikia minuta]UBF30295.1 low molecular weight protein tyrosine phosphatase family protein [Kovacikia minuta CCNUW1]